jgi:hypothetical protein
MREEGSTAKPPRTPRQEREEMRRGGKKLIFIWIFLVDGHA